MEEEVKFASVMQRLKMALAHTDEMEKIERLVLNRRLDRLKHHFGKLEDLLRYSEGMAKAELAQAKSNASKVQLIERKANKTESEKKKVQDTEKAILKREAQLRDEVLTITQKLGE